MQCLCSSRGSNLILGPSTAWSRSLYDRHTCGVSQNERQPLGRTGLGEREGGSEGVREGGMEGERKEERESEGRRESGRE